jgi:phosphatidylglycerophosphatase A
LPGRLAKLADGAFLLFRLFDIVKPQPARFFDRQVKNGFGVMTDDFFAGVYTVLVLQIASFALS